MRPASSPRSYCCGGGSRASPAPPSAATAAAARQRLVRQLLTESFLLALVGGALGVLIAASVAPVLARLVPHSLPIAETPAMDLRVLAFALVLIAGTGIAFGVLPASRASHAG